MIFLVLVACNVHLIVVPHFVFDLLLCYLTFVFVFYLLLYHILFFVVIFLVYLFHYYSILNLFFLLVFVVNLIVINHLIVSLVVLKPHHPSKILLTAIIPLKIIYFRLLIAY